MNAWLTMASWVARRRLLRKVQWRDCAWNPAMAAENQLRREIGRSLKIHAELAVQIATSTLIKMRAQRDHDIALMQYQAAFNREQIRIEAKKFRSRM